MTDKPLEQLATTEKTISFEHFLEQYDSQGFEWHAGKAIPKVTNNTRHNDILGFLYQLLSLYLDISSLGKVILAGVPMFLGDDKPAREPDLMIILNNNLSRLKEKYLEGVADIAVEIVSPGSTTMDRGDKFIEYETAGVPEYWLIDPIRKEALFYHLNDEGHYQRIESGQSDLLKSKILPAFTLEEKILWQEKLPEGMAIVTLVQNLTTKN